MRRAADIVNAESRVAILAGRGCLDAKCQVLELAQKVGGPIIRALLGKFFTTIAKWKNDQIVEEYVMLDPRDIMKQVVP